MNSPRRSTLSLTALLAAALLPCPASGQASPAALDPQIRARFGFVGPTLAKLADGIDQMSFVPGAPGDGKQMPGHIHVHNGRRGRLEKLTFTPATDDGSDSLTVSSERLPTTLSAYGLYDLTRNGQPDLVRFEDSGRLSVRLQEGATSRELPGIEVGRAGVRQALALADLDGDGRGDAVVVTRDGVVVVLDLAGSPKVSRPDPVLESRLRSFELMDLDGDGLLDVVIHAVSERYAVQWKRGLPGGRFGPWILLEGPAPRSIFPGAGHEGRPTLCAIEGQQGRLVESTVRTADGGGRPSLQWTSLPTSGKQALPHAVLDMTGDGTKDIVLADPERASLLWAREVEGAYEIRTAPTLAGVASLALADLDGDGKVDILLAAPEEDALAWKSGALPFDAFPVRIPVPGKPVAVGVSNDRVVHVLVRDSKRNVELRRLRFVDGAFVELDKSMVSLGRLANDPVRLLVADLDDEAGDEVAFVVPGEGLRIVRGAGDPEVPMGEAAGFTRRMDDGALDLVVHQGKPALMVVRDRFARVFRLDPSGQPLILHQDNGPDGSQLAMAAMLDADTHLFVDRQANKLLRIGDTGTLVSVDLPNISATHLYAIGDSAVIVAPKGILKVPFRGGHELHVVRSSEPPLEQTVWYRGLAVDLDNDGRKEIALLDAHLHGVHILVADGTKLTRALSFPVFELPEARDNVYEPRELAAGDVDGDGRMDLLLICHDRILVYRQEP